MSSVSLANTIRTVSPFVLGGVGSVALVPVAHEWAAEVSLDRQADDDLNYVVSASGLGVGETIVAGVLKQEAGEDDLFPPSTLVAHGTVHAQARKRAIEPEVDWTL